MNNLTLALACAGVALLAAIVAHSAWQARKISALKPLQPHSAEQREPVFSDPSSVPAQTALPTDAMPLEPALDGPVDSAPPPPKHTLARIDALIDAIATLSLEAPISGDLALTHLPTTRRAGTKPFLIEGWNTQHKQWEFPLAGQRYRECPQ
jgi:hypothetical protein